ncbi:MAG: hypothetical protein HYR76_06630 [Ignavibacteria bacterium]|nr:hypothetical protein [Ignavibacteria bacterium]MBI3766477.1 hypothetical protein [Ignavibacteriales bacterium]
MKRSTFSHMVFIALTVTMIFTLSASAGNGGSAYSRYGLGDIRFFNNDHSMGMGGASIAVLSTSAIDRMNPAGWSQINRTRFSVSVLYEGFSTSDNSRSAFLSGMAFNGFMVAVPIATDHGIVFGAGITPFSRINYNVITQKSQAGFLYDEEYIGDGGLSVGHVGLSATLAGDIHLGTKMNYYFGTLNYITRQTFPGGQYTNAEVIRSTKLSGVGVTVGAIYSGLRKVFNMPTGHSLNLGLVVSTASNLSADEERFFSYTTSTTLTTRDTSMSPDGTIHLPFSWGGGLSYLTDRYQLAADLYYQNWYQYSANGVNAAELRDSYRFGVGGEILPKRDQSAPFTQRIAYRLGFFYNSTYYRLRGEPINEIGLTTGFGLPIISETRLTIGAEYSFRGTTNQQLQKDKILRISFTLSGGELWFVRPAEE